MPSEHEKETAFLRRCIRYEDTAEGRQLDERIATVQDDERCVRRATHAMALVAMLAVSGLVYGALFLDDFPFRMSVFAAKFIIEVLCAVGVGSAICFLAFTCLGLIYRKKLNQRREECRTRFAELLESRLGRPQAMNRNGEVKALEAMALHSEAAAAPEAVNLPGAKQRTAIPAGIPPNHGN